MDGSLIERVISCGRFSIKGDVIWPYNGSLGVSSTIYVDLPNPVLVIMYQIGGSVPVSDAPQGCTIIWMYKGHFVQDKTDVFVADGFVVSNQDNGIPATYNLVIVGYELQPESFKKEMDYVANS